MMEAIEPLHCQMLIVHSNDAMTVPEKVTWRFCSYHNESSNTKSNVHTAQHGRSSS